MESFKHLHPNKRLMTALLTIAILGLCTAVIAVAIVPERGWPNLLLASYYCLGLGLAAAVFIALQYVSNAGWSVGFRRVPEAMISTIPAAAVALFIAIAGGMSTLYEWSVPTVLMHDALLRSKTWWLNVPFFTIRTALFLVIWLVIAYAITRTSRDQDKSGAIELTTTNRKYSAVMLVLFGFTFPFASMDWIMSLEPHWSSTIFGIYNFAGVFLNGLAVITMLTIFMKRMGPFRNVVSEDHLHSLGKLIFAFSTFWMYIWFSQYMLIWYSNLPEEATYFIHRQKGSWLIFMIVNVLFNWAIPFLLLLPSWTKKNSGLLFKVCIIIMIGHWIDLFWMIFPPFMPNAPTLGIWEVAPLAGLLAFCAYVTLKAFARGNPVPVNDPMLVESMSGH